MAQEISTIMNESVVSVAVLLTTALGLHARPSVKLTRTAKTFPCRVELSLSEDGPWIDGKSPVQVMRFRVAQGQHLHLRASGEAAAQAISALVDLVRRNFDEEDGERDHPNPACSTSGDGHG